MEGCQNQVNAEQRGEHVALYGWYNVGYHTLCPAHKREFLAGQKLSMSTYIDEDEAGSLDSQRRVSND